MQDDRDTGLAHQWIKEHPEKLKGKVYKPVRLEIRAKNVAHAKYIETVVNYQTAKVCAILTEISLCNVSQSVLIVDVSYTDHHREAF